MNIFVGNLSRDVTEEELREAFSAFGQVSKVTICRYEKHGTRPDPKVLNRLKRRFKLNGEFNRYL